MRIPTSTYRLQLHRGFTFEDARDIVDYLERLGITDVYLSPITRARSGSTHGYDVCDPAELNPELGGDEGFVRLTDELVARDMGALVDIVPNHMAASDENPWWWDVLARGHSSPYAGVFDIDWEAGDGQIIIPVLGRPYGSVLEAGDLRVERNRDGDTVVTHHDHRFPLSPRTRRGLGPRAIRALRGTPGDPSSFEALDRVLRAQFYRLSYWRSGTLELNYRRFFDITELVSLRQEDPHVFSLTHGRLLELVGSGRITGLRIDHVDGLRDPLGYLRRLRDALPDERAYVVVEKILDRHERLPDRWPVAGTVGYEFLNALGGLFVDPVGAERLHHLTEERTDLRMGFQALVRTNKRFVLDRLFAGEVDRLATGLHDLAATARHGRDLARRPLKEALTAVSADLGVYRTYIDSPEVSAADRKELDRALRSARRDAPEDVRYAIDFLASVLDRPSGPRLEWVMRWQQLTGPAMAKGFEDTTLYVWPALASRNEVGGDPGEPAVAPAELHRLNDHRLRRWPGGLNTTSTHDTKRSEDVRARLDVLTEIPDAWEEHLDRWVTWHAPLRSIVDGVDVPDPIDETFLYQAIVGAWPLMRSGERGFGQRIGRYMVKATREAKRHTSWRDPNDAYEKALRRYIKRVLSPSNDRFRADLVRLVDRIALPGAVNSLAQTVLKIASPGVPDIYQGSELWHLRLVDPDNREPVDFARNGRALDAIDAATPDDLLSSWRDGRVKLFVVSRALRHRRDHPDLYLRGSYLPLEVSGPRAANVFAFARRRRRGWAVAVVPRLWSGLKPPGGWPTGPEVWGRTTLRLPARAPGRWRDVITSRTFDATSRGEDRSVRLSAALGRFPVALLTSGEEE